MQLEPAKPKAQLLQPLDIKAGQGVMLWCQVAKEVTLFALLVQVACKTAVPLLAPSLFCLHLLTQRDFIWLIRECFYSPLTWSHSLMISLDSIMKFMFSQNLAQVPVQYVSVQCRRGLITVLYGTAVCTDLAKNTYKCWTPIKSWTPMNAFMKPHDQSIQEVFSIYRCSLQGLHK